MDSQKAISWRDLPGNKFNRSLHKAMLSDDGYRKFMPVKTEKGKGMTEVVYDSSYIYEYLIAKAIIPLWGISKQEFIAFIDYSYQIHQQRLKAQEQLSVDFFGLINNEQKQI